MKKIIESARELGLMIGLGILAAGQLQEAKADCACITNFTATYWGPTCGYMQINGLGTTNGVFPVWGGHNCAEWPNDVQGTVLCIQSDDAGCLCNSGGHDVFVLHIQCCNGHEYSYHQPMGSNKKDSCWYIIAACDAQSTCNASTCLVSSHDCNNQGAIDQERPVFAILEPDPPAIAAMFDHPLSYPVLEFKLIPDLAPLRATVPERLPES